MQEMSDYTLFGDDGEGRPEPVDREGKKLPGAMLVEKLPYIPLAFLGLGIYRAWIELVFVGSFIEFPFTEFAGHDSFDIVMIITLFTCAACARFIGPFFKHRSIYLIAALSLIVSTALAFASIWHPELASAVALPATVLGGFGIALVILMWSELYSCLNPYRVALYYCASIIVAAFILYLCRGLSTPWQFAMALTLPVVSIGCVMSGYIILPRRDLPHAASAHFTFPWKPTMLMAIYALAYGLRESSQYASSYGPHSASGTLAVGVFILLLLIVQGDRFDFTELYRIALPLMVGAFLVVPAFGLFGDAFSNFCAMAGYTAFSVLIMLILANMSYRYGISAIWLFGIERGVRALFSVIGRQVSSFIGQFSADVNVELIIGAIIVLLVVAGTMILFSEKELTSRWGVNFKGEGKAPGERVVARTQDLENRCNDIAQRFELSSREAEVLLMMAKRKSVGAIARDMYISKDTVKTHVRHVYRKMDVHSRDELYDVLGVEYE